MKRYNLFVLVLLSMVSIGLSACRNTMLDEDRYNIGTGQSGITGADVNEEWVPASFGFNATELLNPSKDLRALTPAQENEIKQGGVRIFAFKTDEKFDYEAKVTKVLPNSSNKNADGKVQLLVKNSAEGRIFVMLANVDTSIPSTDFKGKTIDEVMAEFSFSMPGDRTWKGGDLPMWAQTPAIVVNHNNGANPNLGTFYLIRALARIDVGLRMTTAGAEKFSEKAEGIDGIELLSVKFYNMNYKGTVAPLSANYDDSKKRVTKPTIPAITPSPSLIQFEKSDEIKENKLLLRSVYVPEAVNTPEKATQAANGETITESQDAYLQRPYMVVKLKGADKKNPNKDTYFRIDFLKREGQEADAKYTYLPLLRNYRYMVDIQSVGGPGFDKEEDAQKGPAANIMYNVVVWNESDMTDVKYDGQYMLGVSQDHLKFYHDGGEIKIKAQTSWPGGLEVPELPDWVAVTKVPVDPNKNKPTDEYYLIFKVKDPTAQPRTGKGYIQAGRIRWNLEFEQTNMIDVHIDIFSDADCTQPLQFSEINQFGEKYDPNNENKSVKIGTETLTVEEAKATLTFYVKTAPQNLKPEILGDSFSKFKFSGPVDMGQGIWRYTVTAKDITANDIKFESFTDSFEFKITHKATKQSAQARLTLLQKEYDAIPFGEKELHTNLIEDPDGVVYLLDGSTQSFFMQANTDYQLKMTSNISNNGKGKLTTDEVNVTTTNNNPTMGGTKVDFHAVDDLQDPKLFSGRVKYELTSPTGKFPKKEFYIVLISAIKQPEANTYMIQAGAKQGILIPASRVNTARKYYETLLNLDTDYFSGTKESKKLPGTKEEFMLNELADDDDFSVNIVWTDMYAPGAETKTKRAGLKALGRVGDGGPDSYIFVMAGESVGNVLISIQSNKLEGRPILWSWHIWVVDEYPTVITHTKDNEKNKWVQFPLGKAKASDVSFLSRLLGARTKPTKKNDDNFESFGMVYQWGRKDPFPPYKVVKQDLIQFHDGEGRPYNFAKQQKGERGDGGGDDAINAVGASLTMRGAIEHPGSVVSHQSFWQFELFPHGNVSYFSDKYLFRYPWNRYRPEIDQILHPNLKDYEIIGGKTVFDPSPYGFRIMNYSEAITMACAYHSILQYCPITGILYDGSYNSVKSKDHKDDILHAVCQSRNTAHAPYQLVNTSGWTTSSYNSASYRRAMGFSVRPVLDPEHFGDPNKKDYTVYLPKK